MPKSKKQSLIDRILKSFRHEENENKCNRNCKTNQSQSSVEASQIAIELSNVAKKKFSTIKEAIDEVEKEINDGSEIILMEIDENFEEIYEHELKNLKQIIVNNLIVVLQSITNGQFCILWKNNADFFILYILDNISMEKLQILQKFLIKFLQKSLQQQHSGISPDEIDSINKLNVPLTSFSDADNFNLLFHASKYGESKVVEVLLEVNFDVETVNSFLHLPVDYAYINKHYGTVLAFLKANSMFPYRFKVEDSSEEIKKFAEMCENFHKFILTEDIENARQIMIENPNLRYFYNTSNRSASLIAIGYKKFKIYKNLIGQNLFFSPYEDIHEITAHFNEEEKKQLHEINFENIKNIQNDQHLSILMSKSFVAQDNFEPQEKRYHVLRAFGILNNIPVIKILLETAALIQNFHIVFDFNHDSVNYLDPTQRHNTFGVFYPKGRIYVGAKQLLDPRKEYKVFGTIAHEICHFVITKIYKNYGNPYERDDVETEEIFEIISNECKDRKDVHKLIREVYNCYDDDEIHAELIVRVPHFYAYYYKSSSTLENIKRNFDSLFNFYELNVMSKLESSLIEMKQKIENEKILREKEIITEEENVKAKGTSVSIKTMIIILLFLTSIGFYTNLILSNIFQLNQIKISNEFADLNEQNKIILMNLSYGQIYKEKCCILNDDIIVINQTVSTFQTNEEMSLQVNITELKKELKNYKIEKFDIFLKCIDAYCKKRNDETNLPINISKLFPILIAYVAQRYEVKQLTKENFENLKELQILDLSNNLIETIDKGVFDDLIELKYLNLENNKIQNLNFKIFANNLKLKYFILNMNQIINITSEHFNSLSKLNYLSVCGNKLTTLESNIFENLKDLEKLKMCSNQFTLLPNDIFKNLIRLTFLNLAENSLMILDENIFQNNLKLEFLYLYKNKIIKITSNHFNHLTNLVEFSLCENQLSKIETNMFNNLVNLNEFHLCFNQLTFLPADIFKNFVNLKYTNLQKNQFGTLEENIFSNNPKLEKLVLSSNNITKLSSKILDNKPNLTLVDLRWNRCINKIYDIENLSIQNREKEKYLLKKVLHDYCSNDTEVIDGVLAELHCCESDREFPINRMLKAFKISTETYIQTRKAQIRWIHQNDEVRYFGILNFCNGYTCFNRNNIKFLPVRVSEIFPNIIAYFAQYYDVQHLEFENFKNLKKLEFLNLKNNLIDTIEENTFNDLIELKYLILLENKIKYLNSKLFKNNLKLKHLNFRKNQITDIAPQTFAHLKSLTLLSLSENKVTYIETNMFDNLVNLEKFFFSVNQIALLPADVFKNLKNLRFISLGQNEFTTFDDNIFSNNANLNELILWKNKITKLSTRILDNKPNLTLVDLRWNSCINEIYGSKNSTILLTKKEIDELRIKINKQC